MLVAASHLLIGLMGAVLLYVALFLRETEEGRLQNRLEKLWVDIDDLSKAALSRQTAFLQRVSAMADSTLNRLFGVRFFSAGAVSASLSFSIGSLLLLMSFDVTDSRAEFGIFLIAAIISFLIGLSPIPFRYLGFLLVPGSIVFLAFVDWRSWRWELNWNYLMNESVLLLIMSAGGFLSDVLFIAASRWCLRVASQLKDGLLIAALLTMNGCIGLLLVFSPLLIPFFMVARARDLGNASVGIMLVGLSNLFSGLLSLLFILLSLTALLHLAVWPMLERPIYSLQRFGVARSPKLLAAASATCLMFAWPHSPVIQAITKLVHG